jgi:hypothetical protein
MTAPALTNTIPVLMKGSVPSLVENAERASGLADTHVTR